MLKVDGPEDKAIYSGKEVDAVYLGDKRRRTWRAVADGRAAQRSGHADASRSRSRRARRCSTGTCSACHQANGAGLPGVFPPLAKSDYLCAGPEARDRHRRSTA